MRHARGRLVVLEFGGMGGVYQHSLALVLVLDQLGYEVTLLTSLPPEFADTRVDIRRALAARRGSPAGKMFRLARDLAAMFMRIPQLPQVVWVQGSFVTPITLVYVLALRLCRKSVILSPHNLFSRHGGVVSQWLLDRLLKLANTLVAYNSTDAETMRRAFGHTRVLELPLLQYAPTVPAAAMERWRRYVLQNNIALCGLGQIRPDKNYELLASACDQSNLTLLIAGSDTKGGLAALRKYIDDHRLKRVIILEEYLKLEDLVAIACAVGTVALPYSIGSQSGVAALVRRYGVRTIGTSVGGLSSQVDVVVDSLGQDAWAEALEICHTRNRAVSNRPCVEALSELEAERLTEVLTDLGA